MESRPWVRDFAPVVASFAAFRRVRLGLLLHPAAFAPLRTLFLASHALTVAGWVLFPTAPPRLLGDSGFDDTLVALWGPTTAQQSTWLQSAYAAMPSGHVAFALVAGGAVLVLARRPILRLAGGLYPLAVTGLTLVTANHLWLDAAGAVVVVGIAGAVTLAMSRTPRFAPVVAAKPR